MRILLVEDEPKLAALLQRGLSERGDVVLVATTGAQALDLARSEALDVVVLDVMLPDTDGFAVCRTLRDRAVWTPVLLLTARSTVRDRVEGLDAGADDYLTKPFAFAELLARLRALARRGAVERPTVLSVGDLTLDPASRRVARGEAQIELSHREYLLLETFLRSPGQVLSRDQLLDHAWEPAPDHRSNVVDVYVRYLREKVDRPFGRASLETVRGAGYRLVDDRPTP